jgi:O-antigen/teichoic acid export membrane protein
VDPQADRVNGLDHVDHVDNVENAASQRTVVAKGMIFVGAATLLGNGTAYLLSMVSARILDPADFGALGALLGLLVIIATLGISIQALTARRVSTASASEREDVEGQAIRLSVLVAIAIGIGAGVLAWPVSVIFSIPILAVLTGVASLGFVVIGSAAMGIAQGREEHVKLSIAFIANSASRALGGILGVVVLQSVTGVGFGVLIGCAIGAAIAYQLIAPKTFSPKLKDGISIEFGHVAHALIVLFTLTNIDVLLARVFLTEDLSGEYSVGVLLAKIAFFLPNAIIIVLFPKMSGGGSHRALYIATGLTAMVGVVITLASVFAGDLIIAVLGGSQYKELGGEAWLFALEGSAFALVQVLLYSRLAAQDRRAVLAVWGALAVLAVVVIGWRHNSVAEIVTSVVAVSLVLTAVGFILDRRQNVRVNLPIEAAE